MPELSFESDYKSVMRKQLYFIYRLMTKWHIICTFKVAITY